MVVVEVVGPPQHTTLMEEMEDLEEGLFSQLLLELELLGKVIMVVLVVHHQTTLVAVAEVQVRRDQTQVQQQVEMVAMGQHPLFLAQL